MHLDHGQKGDDGDKDGLGWCHTGEILCEIQGRDGRIQR